MVKRTMGDVRRIAIGLVVGALLGTAAAVVWSHQGDDGRPLEIVQWDRWERVDGRTVRVFATSYHSPSCYVPDPTVGYSRDAITITLRFRRSGEFCTLENGIGDQPVLVQLDEDLGTRAVHEG